MKLILSVMAFLTIGFGYSQKSETKTVKETNKPLNVILLIGDGMGLSQMSSVFYFKKDSINLPNFEHVGLLKTSSSSHLITDSAAGATAYACGVKTYNGAIGVLQDTTAAENMTEVLSKMGYKNGLVATSSITHATPASFFAHMSSRKMDEAIAAQLPTSNIDFFAAGGLKFFNKRKDGADYIAALEKKGFEMDTVQLGDKKLKKNRKYGYLLAEDGMPKMTEGRGDFLQEGTEKALSYLSQTSGGFFLMVEGSQIDWGGHDNEAQYLIEEMKDFDNVIGAVLDFAKKDGNTLVLMTADHETGGFTLASKEGDYNAVTPTFSTGGHSGTMVPVLAYGKGAENFGGIYENNELYHKILALIQQDRIVE
ncbi:alkaline phosphatase [Mangrovimonas sp. DI 80]|uniref:alkaline phosphatase n=1 Tax=Mangrovimonas sp. DI 80 TaxID=1779330 RepID=UPI000976EB64|nr:alkaline phosphatase [Mangrovimonas sp. DI 80]OMP30137.1 alkaline phosphatase [Mangrovimonas sp. DI 80]